MNAVRLHPYDLLPQRNQMGPWALTFILTLLSSLLGFELYANVGTSPALIWPVAGLSLAPVFVFGYRMWSAIALASLTAALGLGFAFLPTLGWTLGITVQAVIGAYLFRAFSFQPDISRLRDTILLVGASLCVSVIFPTLFFSIKVFSASGPGIGKAWLITWSGGILSILLLTPLFTTIAKDFRIVPERMLEHVLSLCAIAALAFVIFWMNITEITDVPLVYFLLIPHFIMALRLPPRSTVLGLCTMAVIAITGDIITPVSGLPVGQTLFQTQLLVETYAVMFLVLTSIMEERRNAARLLQEHIDQAEEALTTLKEHDKARSDFLATLAHELRNPLAPVLSTLELLRLKRPPSDEENALIAGAEQRLHMMSRLLDDLLDISRISEKRLELKKEYVQFHSLAKRSVDGAMPFFQKHGHTVNVSLPAKDITLFADPIRVEQIFVNILTNAAKYTNPNGHIEFIAQDGGRYVEVRVRDNGTGIDKSMLNRVFEPFLRVASTKYGSSGVGIGLALAKELVEMHQGSIRAESDGVGKGSTFIIKLPVATPPAQTTLPLSKSVVERMSKPLRILIIDDNQAGSEALGRLLKFRGHHTKLAFNGVSGLRIALDEQPDVVLLDIGLPDIDGYEVAHRLRQHKYRGLIVALTGYGQDEDRKKAIDAGCDEHLIKPVGLKDIESLLMSRFSA